MVEKAVDRALLANPDKNLDRAAMISQALETLRRDNLAKSNHKNVPPNPSTSTGFPSYKPTPISILNKRHIPVVAMPVKPMVIRKDKRSDEKNLIGAPSVISASHNFTSHTSKLDAPAVPNSTASSIVPPAENTSEDENNIPLVQQISDFLDTEMRTNEIKTANIDDELPSPPFSQDSVSEHSNTDSVDANGAMGNPHFDAVTENQCSNANGVTEKKSDSSLHSAPEVVIDSNVPSSSIESDKCIYGLGNNEYEVDVMAKQKEVVPKDAPSTENSEEIRSALDPLPPKSKDKEHLQSRAHSMKTSNRRHSGDTKKSSDSHRKSDKSVHRSSKHSKDGKSDHRKHSEKEKNGLDSQKMEKPIKDSERESCHKKPSLHHANFPKKCLPTNDQSTSHSKKSDKEHHGKKPHHNSHDQDNQKHKEKHHHSHKHDLAENDRKRESREEKSKPVTEHSSKPSKNTSSSHSKSKTTGKQSSSHSKDSDKAKKRKADDDNEKRSKVAKITPGGDNLKEKDLKSNTHDNPNQINDTVEARSRRDSGSRGSRESIKRKRQSGTLLNKIFIQLDA